MVVDVKEKSKFTGRVARIREAIVTSTVRVDTERFRFLLESYKETEGEPAVIRRAKLFDKILTHKSIHIDDNPTVGSICRGKGMVYPYPNFLVELFRRCQELGFHTTLDTRGYVKGKVIERILQYPDLVLYDIKHMDSERHKELTRVGNELILGNAERVAYKMIPMIIRVPLIPGQNDSDENINALAEFATKLGLTRIDVLPYH